MLIYTKDHPQKTAELIQYMALIRAAAYRQGGFAWRSYDEQFRIRQAAFPVSWGSINHDLWLRCMSFKGPSTQQSLSSSQKQNICKTFNGFSYHCGKAFIARAGNAGTWNCSRII